MNRACLANFAAPGGAPRLLAGAQAPGDVGTALSVDRMTYPAMGLSSPSRTPSARRMADPERTLSFGVLE